MSDRVKRAREIAARPEPRFLDMREDIKDLKGLAREIAARTPAKFVTIHKHRGGSPVFTESELTAKRGGPTAEGISPEDDPPLEARLARTSLELSSLRSFGPHSSRRKCTASRSTARRDHR
jgi:hypothetical protein